MTPPTATAPPSTLGLIAVLAALLIAALLLALRLRLQLRAARAESARLVALLEAIPDQALLLLDASGRVRHWNAAARRLHGFRPTDALGEHYAFLFTPEQRQQRVPENDLERAAGAPPLTERVARVRRDGQQLLVESRLSALRDEEGRLIGFSVLESDLQGRLQQERALVEARSRIAGVRKLAALGRLSEGIAHEFNNVVHVIRTSVALLQRHRSGDAQATESLRMIERNADRAAGLSQHLLALSRRQPGTPLVTDVNTVVSDVVVLLRQTLHENIVVEEQLADSLCRVIVDRSELEAALLHAAASAREGMSAGGRLTLSTAEVMLRADPADGGSAARHSVAIRIQQAIEEGQPLAVDAAATEDSMELVQGLLTRAQGQLQVQRLAQGSIVTLYLPCRAG